MYRTYLAKATQGASNHAQTRLHTHTHTHRSESKNSAYKGESDSRLFL